MADPTILPADSPFATMTNAQALASVNRAISVVESGTQRYRIGDRELHRGDLRWMYPERARLQALVAAEQRASSGGPRFRRAIPI